MTYSLNQPNQLAFVGGELEMASSEGPAEESEGFGVLVENNAEPRT